jgi:deoxycytidine triphosphate deaminase
MSVLSAKEIQRRLNLPISNKEKLVITPLLDDSLDQDSIDLRLGCYFRSPSIGSIDCIRPEGSAIKHYPELIHKPYEPYKENKKNKENCEFILQPHHAVLASTLEYIKMPYDTSGQILTKSSWARVFISIASAPWIHPLYRGCLTLEITNLGNVPIALQVGRKIAQLVLLKVDGDLTDDPNLIKGTYIGAIMPEAPKFKS